MRIVLSTWGDPLNWQEMEYRCHEDFQGPGTARGNTTLVCYGQADATVIIAPDSIPSTTTTQPRHGKAQQCYMRVYGVEPGQTPIAPQCTDLRCWREKLTEYIKCVAGGIGRDVEVVPIAAIGRYGKYEFKGHPELTQTDALTQLAGLVRRLGCGDRVEILLDLTHGVNYVPATILGVVVDHLAQMLAVRCGVEVLVKAYNAVPSGQNLQEFQKVYSRVVRTVEAPGGEGDRVINAFTAAMPLALAKLCQDPQLCDTPQVTVTGRVTHPTSKQPGQITYGRAPKLSSAASRLLASEICQAVNKYVRLVNGAAMLKLEDLEELFSYAKRFAGKLAEVTSHEIYAVGDQARRADIPDGRCARLCELYGTCSDEARGDVTERLKRNFLAHGGLLRDLVKVCNMGGEKLLGYVAESDDERLARLVDRLIDEALR